MPPTLITSILGLIGSLLVAAFTYWAAKRKEQDAAWRKEKLEYYKAFIESMNGVIEGDATPEGHQLYAQTTNNLLLFAPQSVIEALNAYRSEIAMSNKHRTNEAHDQLLTKLLLAIRADVGIKPCDNPNTFEAILWSSGVRKNAA